LIGRKIFQTVDGGVNFSRKQGFLEFPGEEASLRRVRKAQIKPFVAGGLNNLDLDAQLSVRGPEFFGYDPGLSERQIFRGSKYYSDYSAITQKRPARKSQV
jgi:hypothetical protein